MNRIDLLKKNFQRLCEYSWDRNVSGAQRVWLAVYDKEDERKLRLRLGLFEEATHHSGHKWMAIDLTDAFANWMCGVDNATFAESYFESPELLDDAVLVDMKQSVVTSIRGCCACTRSATVIWVGLGTGPRVGCMRCSPSSFRAGFPRKSTLRAPNGCWQRWSR